MRINKDIAVGNLVGFTFTYTGNVKQNVWSGRHNHMSGNVCNTISDIIENFHFQLLKNKEVNILDLPDIIIFLEMFPRLYHTSFSFSVKLSKSMSH